MKNKPAMQKGQKNVVNVISDYSERIIISFLFSVFEGYLLFQKDYLTSGFLLILFAYICLLWYNCDKQAKNKALNNTFRKMEQLEYKTMLHDIKAPINGILSVVHLLIEDDSDEKVRQESYNSLLIAASQAWGVTQNTNDFNAINKGKRPVLKNDFITCEDWIADIIKLVRHDADTKAITIDTDVEEKRKFYADRVRITQITLNLLSNAIKFSHRDSKVIIKIIREVDHIVVSIKDEGVGIDVHMQEKLFMPYERQYPEIEGEGLGLYSSKVETSIIGGELSVVSYREEGVTATLKIPVI